MRALAALWREDGAAGVYLYNFYTMSSSWNRRTTQELTDPAALAGLDRRYEIFRPRSYEGGGGHSTAFKYASPVTQLPARLAPSQGGGEWIRPEADPQARHERRDRAEAARDCDSGWIGCSNRGSGSTSS